MLLNNRYRILRTLGSGGFGETILAEDTQMPSLRRCVIKQLKPIHNNPQINQLVQERFQREAAILEELGDRCDQIPALYAYFQLDEQFYLVQEYIEGDTLTAKVRHQGVLSERAVCEIITNLLPVLEYVHSKHIVHRDIKPDNIILRHRDGKPVLIDFGAVRETMGTVLNSQGSPTSSIIIGTPGYMPSEQAIGRPVYASDLYSLGLTAIYILTGKQPQELETDPSRVEIVWHSHAVNVSSTIAAVLDRAIAYHPRDRFASATEMLQALQSGISVPFTIPSTPTVLSTQPPTTPPSSTKSQKTISVSPQPSSHLSSHQDSGRRRMLINSIIAVGGLIGASIVFGIALIKSPQPEQQPQISENTTSQPQKIPTTTDSNTNSTSLPSSFYFLADSAYPNSQTAVKQVKTLQAAGYSQAGMFWIPEYPNLSGKELFEVYVARFSDRNSCIDLLRTYGKAKPSTYCALASKDVNASPQRVYFQQISTSSTLLSSATVKDFSWLSRREVTEADLNGKDGFELDIMRNSIFARHGRRFNTIGLQKYFDAQPWYRPKYSPDEFPNELLSDLERWNAEYINEYQDRYNRRYFK